MNRAHATPGMEALRARIEACALPRLEPDRRMIATWNIRAFGAAPRREDSLAYIAEVMSHFDLVAIVELRQNLTDLDAVLAHLGPHWDALFTGVIRDPAGNHERACYAFNTRRVRHRRLAWNPQAPRTKAGDEYLPKLGWWRPPYLAAFRAGDTDLLLLTAHVRWGRSARARLSELTLLADWVATEIGKDPFCANQDVIALGDFNIPNERSPLFAAVQARGLTIPTGLLGTHGSNLAKNKRYDQILHAPGSGGAFTGRAGALDFYSGPGGVGALYPRSVDAREFTFEMSDHLPLWAELATRRTPP
ncbi:MAG: endonuclease/exonuclease/phosphatase family protein [Polyangiaceae bacterium]